MSVVLVTPAGYEPLRRTISHLRAQTVMDRLEIIIVAPEAARLDLREAEEAGFQSVRLVEASRLNSLAAAVAAGIRQARAEVVALGEDHSFPDPGWAAALIAAHRQPWAAVGPVVANINPGDLISWANLLIEYYPFLEPVTGGVRDLLPGHNSAYKRSLLLDYGEKLEGLLEAETVLHWDLRDRGHRLYLEPAARTRHLKALPLSCWIPLRFYCGRQFAASRARNRGWSLSRRLFYSLSAPLIPLVRLVRALRRLELGELPPGLRWRLLAAMIFMLLLDGTGEMVGYVLGPGRAKEKLTHLDFQVHRYLRVIIPA